MKKSAWGILILTGLILAECTPGVVVTRPVDVTYVRPVSPGHGWVWVSGDWIWASGKYHWREGYWHQTIPGRTWKRGYWVKEPGGYKWEKGRWL